MTKKEAWEEFKRDILPMVEAEERKDGFGHHRDRPRRAEAWNNFTDALCKAKRIRREQYDLWAHPRELGS